MKNITIQFKRNDMLVEVKGVDFKVDFRPGSNKIVGTMIDTTGKDQNIYLDNDDFRRFISSPSGKTVLSRKTFRNNNQLGMIAVMMRWISLHLLQSEVVIVFAEKENYQLIKVISKMFRRCKFQIYSKSVHEFDQSIVKTMKRNKNVCFLTHRNIHNKLRRKEFSLIDLRETKDLITNGMLFGCKPYNLLYLVKPKRDGSKFVDFKRSDVIPIPLVSTEFKHFCYFKDVGYYYQLDRKKTVFSKKAKCRFEYTLRLDSLKVLRHEKVFNDANIMRRLLNKVVIMYDNFLSLDEHHPKRCTCYNCALSAWCFDYVGDNYIKKEDREGRYWELLNMLK